MPCGSLFLCTVSGAEKDPFYYGGTHKSRENTKQGKRRVAYHERAEKNDGRIYKKDDPWTFCPRKAPAYEKGEDVRTARGAAAEKGQGASCAYKHAAEERRRKGKQSEGTTCLADRQTRKKGDPCWIQEG